MTLDDLARLVRETGKICIKADIFADLFPPGIEDDGAKQRALQFSNGNGFTVRHEDGEVCFSRTDDNSGNEEALRQRRSTGRVGKSETFEPI